MSVSSSSTGFAVAVDEASPFEDSGIRSVGTAWLGFWCAINALQLAIDTPACERCTAPGAATTAAAAAPVGSGGGLPANGRSRAPFIIVARWAALIASLGFIGAMWVNDYSRSAAGFLVYQV